jgi:hypothetical protein
MSILALGFGCFLLLLGWMDATDYIFADRKPKWYSIVKSIMFLAAGSAICAYHIVKGLV